MIAHKIFNCKANSEFLFLLIDLSLSLNISGVGRMWSLYIFFNMQGNNSVEKNLKDFEALLDKCKFDLT